MTTVPPRIFRSRAKPQVEKNCALCGAHFRSGSDRSIHCSRGCIERASELKRQTKRREAAGLDKPYACLECAVEFMRDTRQKVYCSTKCKDAYNGKRRVQVKRVRLNIPDLVTCDICKADYQPRTKTQETCGSRRCVGEMTQRRRTAPCLGCGEPGQYAKRVKDAGYCRTCKPVLRRAPMALATMDGDYTKILELLKARTITTSDGCWEWQGPKTTGGYGCGSGAERLPGGSTKTKMFMTHRLALECKMGRPLGAHQSHHICANTLCCNPDHLQPVTNAENMGEMRARASFQARIAELEAALARYEPNHPLIWAA